MVATRRELNWIIYSLPERRADELKRNLKCLQDCVQTVPVFERDIDKLSKLAKNCCKPHSVFVRGANGRRTSVKKQGSVRLRP